MIEKKNDPKDPHAKADGLALSLSGRGLAFITEELKAEADGLPPMPLALSLKTVLEAEAASIWATAVWVTQRRILARSALFEFGDHPLVGTTVSMPMESSEPDPAAVMLITESSKDNVRKTYGLDGHVKDGDGQAKG